MEIWLILAILLVGSAMVYGLSRYYSSYKVNFVDSVKTSVKMMKSELKKRGIKGVGVLTAQKVGENKVGIAWKLYYRVNGKLYEETFTREFPENKLPAYFLDKLGEEEVDITNDFEQHENFSLSM